MPTGPTIADAFVEILPDFSKFGPQVKKAMSNATGIVKSNASGIDDAITKSFNQGEASAERSLKSISSTAKREFNEVERAASTSTGRIGNVLSTNLASRSGKLGIISELTAGFGGVAPLALGAGAAIGAFAAKGVADFQSIALASGKFADATGLSVEAASRYIEVAGDVGVSANTFQSAFIKMQKAIDGNRAAFGNLVATTKDGSTDLEGTFINVIKHLQGIEDPIKRANEASKLFGRGFSEVVEVISLDADTLQEKLEGVSEQKVISEAELEKARKFREAMDELGDAVQDVGIVIGQQLVPVLSNLAKIGATGIDITVNIKSEFENLDEKTGGILGTVADAANRALNPFAALNGLIEDSKRAFGLEGQAVAVTVDSFNQANAAKGRGFVASQQLADAMRSENTVAGQLSASKEAEYLSTQKVVGALQDENDALQTSINLQLAAVSSTFAVSAAQNSFTTAVEAANTATDDASTAVNEQQVAYDHATQAAIATAAATVQYARDQAAAEGATISATQEQDILIETLKSLASQSSGPVAAAIGEVITKLQTVGAQKPKPTLDTNPTPANTKIDDSQRKINVFGSLKPKPTLDANPVPAATKTANVQRNVEVFGRLNVDATLDANTSSATSKTSSAKSAVDTFGRTRATATLDADTSRLNAAVQRAYDRIRSLSLLNVGSFGLQSGVRNWRGGLTWVGERGPELVNLPRGSDVFSATKSQAIVRDTMRRVGLGTSIGGAAPTPAPVSSMSGGTSVVFGPGSVSVSFVGPAPSASDGRMIGEAIGDGITQVLARRRIVTLGKLAS